MRSRSAYQAIMARNDIVTNQLNKIGPTVEATLDRLMNENKADQDALGPLASAEMNSSLWVAIIISLAAIAMGIAVGYLIARSITRPIHGMTQAMGHLADGNFGIDVPAQGRKDEIGLMASGAGLQGQHDPRRPSMLRRGRRRNELERSRRMEEAVASSTAPSARWWMR